MFKNDSFGEEIYHSMEKQLVSNQLDRQYGFDKLAKAVDYLNNAVSIFEQAGLHEEASEIKEVLSNLTKHLSK